jgi:hypothetical protein
VRADVNGSSLSLWLDSQSLGPALSVSTGKGGSGHAMLGAGDFGEFVQFDNFALASAFIACPAAASAQPPAGTALQTVSCSSEVGLQAGSAFDFSAAKGGPGVISLRGSKDPQLCVSASAPAAAADAGASTAARKPPPASWPVTLEACDATAPAQVWQWVFDAVAPQNKRDSRIEHAASGLCLDMIDGWDGGLGDFPNEGASGIIGSPITATSCSGGQSSSQNFFYDFAAKEIANEGSVTCMGICTV